MYWKARGFALVSALVATAIIVVVAAGLAELTAAASRVGRELDWRAEALSLARSEMERAFAQRLADLSNIPSSEVPGWPGFTKSVAVEPLPNGGMRVTVTVYHPAGEVTLCAERRSWP